jgi:hypothetical protein
LEHPLAGLQVTQGVGGGVQAQFQLAGRPVADAGTRSKIASVFASGCVRLLQASSAPASP